MMTLVITLEIEGDPDDAIEVIDYILDNGILQDAINNHDCDEAGPLHVESAAVDFANIDESVSE